MDQPSMLFESLTSMGSEPSLKGVKDFVQLKHLVGFQRLKSIICYLDGHEILSFQKIPVSLDVLKHAGWKKVLI